MNYIYRNDSRQTVSFLDNFWLPEEILSTPYPVPESLGLTCIQQGIPPDPVLFHDDVTVPQGGQVSVSIPAPVLSHNVVLSVYCMTPSAGVECRFGCSQNKPIPIDVRAFSQTLDWILCSQILLYNPTDAEAVISVSAIEGVA